MICNHLFPSVSGMIGSPPPPVLDVMGVRTYICGIMTHVKSEQYILCDCNVGFSMVLQMPENITRTTLRRRRAARTWWPRPRSSGKRTRRPRTRAKIRALTCRPRWAETATATAGGRTSGDGRRTTTRMTGTGVRPSRAEPTRRPRPRPQPPRPCCRWT